MSLTQIKKQIQKEAIMPYGDNTYQDGFHDGMINALRFIVLEEKKILEQIREYEEEGRKLENLMGYNCKLSIAEVLRGVIGK